MHLAPTSRYSTFTEFFNIHILNFFSTWVMDHPVEQGWRSNKNWAYVWQSILGFIQPDDEIIPRGKANSNTNKKRLWKHKEMRRCYWNQCIGQDDLMSNIENRAIQRDKYKGKPAGWRVWQKATIHIRWMLNGNAQKVGKPWLHNILLGAESRLVFYLQELLLIFCCFLVKI